MGVAVLVGLNHLKTQSIVGVYISYRERCTLMMNSCYSKSSTRACWRRFASGSPATVPSTHLRWALTWEYCSKELEKEMKDLLIICNIVHIIVYVIICMPPWIDRERIWHGLMMFNFFDGEGICWEVQSVATKGGYSNTRGDNSTAAEDGPGSDHLPDRENQGNDHGGYQRLLWVRKQVGIWPRCKSLLSNHPGVP